MTKKKNSIAKNYIYNLMYQILTILLPLITTPYVSRVLGANAIGIYGYTVSIVTYFILFGSLGASVYGQREIAYHQQNREKASQVFWEIIVLRTIFLAVAILLFYLIYGRVGEYVLFYRILIIQLVASIFDISWLFQGIEEFDKTVLRNFLVKIICLMAIFIFVKSPSDLWKYFALYAGAEFIGNLSLWLYIPKYLDKINFKTLQFKRHFKPMVELFLPQVAIQIYTVLDKTMIGKLTNNMMEVGYYEQAQKVVRAALLIVSALQVVMNSRIANAYARKDEEEIHSCLMKSFQFLWLIAVPMMFGLLAIATKFVPWYYGENFEGVTDILMVTAPILVVIGLSGITGNQYLVQVGQHKALTLSVTVGAGVNILFNFLFIPKYGGMGAAFASVIAELVVLGIQLKYLRNQINLLDVFKSSVKCFISGIVMFLVVRLIVHYLSVSIVNTLIECMIGGIVYFIMLILLKYQFLKDLLNQVFLGLKGLKKS